MPRSVTGHLSRDDVFEDQDEFFQQQGHIKLSDQEGSSDNEMDESDQEEELQGLSEVDEEEEPSDKPEEEGQDPSRADESDDQGDETFGERREALPKRKEIKHSDWGLRGSDYFGQDEQVVGTAGFDIDLANEEQGEADELRRERLSRLAAGDFLPDSEMGGLREFTDPDAHDREAAKQRKAELEAMSPEEREAVVHAKFPELPGLLAELQRVVGTGPELQTLQEGLGPKPGKKLSRKEKAGLRKHRRAVALLLRVSRAYAANISFYLSLRMKGVLIKSHPVFERIVALRRATQAQWDRVVPTARAVVAGEAPPTTVPPPLPAAQPKRAGKPKRAAAKPQAEAMDEESPAVFLAGADLPGVKTKKKRKKGEKPSDEVWEKFRGHYKDGVTDGERRPATHKILKNRGLVKYRKREYRHSRLKIRSKHAKKTKARKYLFKEYKGKSDLSYGGEASGIKTGLTRSAKLS